MAATTTNNKKTRQTPRPQGGSENELTPGFHTARLKCGWCGEWADGEIFVHPDGQVDWEKFSHTCPETLEKGVFVEDWEVVRE